jgi:hypothetical protein
VAVWFPGGRHPGVNMPENSESTCRVSILWSSRRKQWDIVVGGGDGRRSWTWSFVADCTIALDEGTAYLVGAAVRDALEAQLV